MSVRGGNELTPTSVQYQPQVEWNALPNTYYTLVMTDPDCPSRKDRSLGEAHHWIVGNILGNDISSGDTIVDFIGSGPLEFSGLHRYSFFVYVQPNGRIEFNETPVSITNLRDRLSSITQAFADKYSLGNPTFGNMYVAQYDAYVPTLHAQFEKIKVSFYF